MILSCFFAALGQLGDPRFRRVLWLGLALTIALLVAATAGLLALIQAFVTDETGLPLIGPVTWLDDVLSVSSVFVMLILSVFLMVPVASAITSMFLDTVADAVEARHYPGLPPARPVPFYEALKDSINFLGVLIAANLAAILLYVFVPFAAPLIFWGLNGLLLGREYFTLAAMRRVGRVRANQMRREHSGTIWLAGALMAVPLTIPLVNLLIPILGAATFTHLFHRLSLR
ncbi:MAG: hypothetical protein EP307_12770 [Rhodobacteraceae bacterium]|nr:MAG: hypothetical protein EP307_12770 [Paracoccaceae bacterium]